MKNFPPELRHGSGAMMTLDPTRLQIAFRGAPAREDAEARLRDLGLVFEDARDANPEKSPRPFVIVNSAGGRYSVRSQSGQAISQDQYDSALQGFGDTIDWIAPVYRLDLPGERSTLLSPMPNVLVIKPVSPEDKDKEAALDEALAKYGLVRVPEKSAYLGDFRYFVLKDPKNQTVYELRDVLLREQPDLVSDARFENMPLIVPTAAVSNDTLLPQQWDMTQIQAAGPGLTGWDISTGANTVVICVLDEGCDLTHPDLQPRYSTPGINLGTMMPDGSPTGNHGTACAGIVAASFNNGQGVAGVAGNCMIMPLAFQAWTDTEVAAGINFAANNGARVISMSFGWDAWDHNIIDPAIQNAFNLDVVMCVATHNYNGAITYPATNPLVMACGASDQIDNRKSPTSPDGENWWGSDFGPEISVVAPGVLIPTTDRQGAAGYNTSAGTAGDYFLMFNGTSSATPHVAGLAGLIRSVCPTWTNVQVRDRIELTADKVGVVPYAVTAGHPNGTWNQEMGYGRINVLRALQKVVPTINWVPAGIVYGTPLGAAQLNATASVPGTFSYSPPAGTCLPAGAHTLTVTFTPNDTCSFSSVTATAVVNVAKATPILSWANPPDIDFGTPLTNTQLNVPLPTWVVCGASGPVGGSFAYNPGAGTVLSVGTHTLCVTFTPTDTANYNNATACVQIHVLTGYPIVLSCTFAPTTLQREERTQVIVVIKNDSVNPHPTQGPPPGFEYSEGDTFLTGARPGRESFPSIAGAYRIAVDVDMVPYPYTQRYLYRWGFGHDLGPGEVVSVNGFIRMHNSRQNAPYYVAMIEEVDNVLIDHQCPTPITVEKP